MGKLLWDAPGEKTFQSGLDKGVLYMPPSEDHPEGYGVPWNGLTSVNEKISSKTDPVYYDGMKISDFVAVGSYEADLSAVTYPEEMEVLEGLGEIRPGMLMADQNPQTFGLCYRTAVGNDVQGATAHYKLHIVYNVTAIPDGKDYSSIGDDPNLIEFSWSLSAVPEEVPGFAPTAHIVLNSKDLDPWLLEELEDQFYGSALNDAYLMPMSQLCEMVNNWFRIKITVNLVPGTDEPDGTWTVECKREGMLELLGDGIFTLLDANVYYINSGEYVISDTKDISEMAVLKFADHGDGIWSASTNSEGLIEIDEESQTFTLHDIDLDFSSEDQFRLNDAKKTTKEPTWHQ